MSVETERDVVREHMAKVGTEAARRIEAEFKVPTSDSLWPGYAWIACVVVPDGGLPGEGRRAVAMRDCVVPTDDEARMIRAYIEHVTERVYNERWQRKILDRELPICGGHNTVIFVKYPEVPDEGRTWKGWGYRRNSWHTGSWPHAYQERENAPGHPLSLVEALDHLSRHSTGWPEWKAAHPEVFGV